MLVVILIIVILLAIAIPSVIGYREDTQETSDLGDARTLYTALEATATKISPLDSDNFVGHFYHGDDDELYPDQTLGNSETNIFLNQLYNFLDDSFKGKYEFGFSKEDGSVSWVTYRRDGTTADDANVMLYHVEDGVYGYLDELDAKYQAQPYRHNR